jgi:hypothetical protein
MAVVYKHTRMDNGLPFYIGIGKTIARAKSKRSRNKYWSHIVNKYGYNVEILHTNISWEEACELEKQYIKQYGRSDLGLGPLVNMTDGGDGNSNFSPIIIEQISNKLKGRFIGVLNPNYDRKHTDEIKRKISLSNKGKILSESHIQSIIKANIGRKLSDEIKRKISQSQMGEKNHMWGKKGINNPNYDRKLSDETKRKISLSNKGKILSESHIQSIIKANTGRKHTKSELKKMSESQMGEKNHMWGKNGSAVSNSKLNSEQVIWIRKNYIKGDTEFGQRALAKKLNVSKTTIKYVIEYKLWKNP